MPTPSEDVIKFLAKSIALKIRNDFGDRCGLQNAWDDIDENIQREILQAWTDIAEETLDTFFNNNY